MKIHNKELTDWHKKSKQNNQKKLIISLIAGILLVFAGEWFWALCLWLTMYLLHELLWSDHIFYDPKSAYGYHFEEAIKQHLVLTLAKTIHISLSNLPTDLENKSAVLAVHIKSHLSGYIFDPYVLINGQAQYFERGVNGKRFVNLSHALEHHNETQNGDIILEFRHCQNLSVSGCFYAFNNPQLEKKKVLFIAPHADDAEIAAFGLYSQFPKQSFITTISAGEIEAEHYQQLSEDARYRAGEIKGLLRSWDSNAIPIWGGLTAQQSLQLGYFCLTLGDMSAKPKQTISSLWAENYSPQTFRQFNQYALKSDHQVTNQWSNLVGDLQEIIDNEKPDIIITPHPYYDPHRDHYFSTKAILEASKSSEKPIEQFFLYANHNSFTDCFPFGKAGSIQSLPPQFTQNPHSEGLFSLPLPPEIQQNKVLALAMMHDLRTPLNWKKRLRKNLQHWILQRDNSPYLENDFVRKAVRQNELFFVCNQKQLKTMLEDNHFGY